MKHKKTPNCRRRKIMFSLYVIGLATLSVSCLLMPFGVRVSDETMLLIYASGALFWIGLLSTIVMAMSISGARRRDRVFSKTNSNEKGCGLFRFFRNKPAVVCDTLMIISAVGLAATCIWAEQTIWPFPFLSLFIFSFGMHCMLNGRAYTYIKS